MSANEKSKITPTILNSIATLADGDSLKDTQSHLFPFDSLLHKFLHEDYDYLGKKVAWKIDP